MTDIATIQEVKTHLRVTHTTEDSVITLYMDAADNYIRDYLNCSNPAINPSIKAAFLLLVGDLYENREATTEKNLSENRAVFRLLYPYREGLGI